MGLQFGLRVTSLVAILAGSVLFAQELPKDAQLLIDENAKTLDEIKTQAETRTKAANEQFRTQLEKLQTTYTKDGKLDEAVAIRDYLRSLASGSKPAIKPVADPGTLTAYRSEVGRVIYFTVTGSDYGNLYGTDVYSHDSRLGAAAVHAGVLKLGETGIVKVTILPGQNEFKATGRNGVSSSSWSQTNYECFKVEPPNAPETAPTTAVTSTRPASTSNVRVDPGSLYGYRDQVGHSFLFEVTGSSEGAVYGSDVYSDDSPLNVAAVHAGLVGVGKKGVVKVTIKGAQDKFDSTSRNGVVSRTWGAYGGSYAVESANEIIRASELKTGELKTDELKNAVIKESLNQLNGLKDALKKP